MAILSRMYKTIKWNMFSLSCLIVVSFMYYSYQVSCKGHPKITQRESFEDHKSVNVLQTRPPHKGEHKTKHHVDSKEYIVNVLQTKLPKVEWFKDKKNVDAKLVNNLPTKAPKVEPNQSNENLVSKPVNAQVEHTSKNVILLQTDHDICAEWSKAFPSHVIIIAGTAALTKSNGNCHYFPGIYDTVETLKFAMTFHPSEILFAKEGPDAIACLTHMNSNKKDTTGYKLMFDCPKKRIFSSVHHWGCGGNELGKDTCTYSVCPDVTPASMGITRHQMDNFKCSKVYPSMVLSSGIYGSTSRQCMYLRQEAFWAIPFMTSETPSRETDIVGMIAEKLNWESGQRAELYPSHTTSRMDTPKYEAVLKKVADVLNNQMPVPGKSFVSLLESTVEDMHKRDYISNDTHSIITKWIKHLKSTNFKFPKLENKVIKCKSSPVLMSYISRQDLDDLKHPHNSDAGILNSNRQLNMETRSATCKKPLEPPENPNVWKQWNETLYVITHNTPVYEALPYVDAISRGFFPHIISCGPSQPDMSDPALRNLSITFISYGSTPGWLKKRGGSYNYECLTLVSRIGYNVGGYIMASDDVFLITHRLQHHNMSHVWYFPFDNMIKDNYYDPNITTCDHEGCHPYWEKTKFWPKLKSTVTDSLETLRAAADTSVAKTCHNNLINLTGGFGWSLRSQADIYYVSSHYLPQVVELFELFRSKFLYLDIAVPITFHCIVPQSDITPIYTHFHNVGQGKITQERNVYSPDIALPANPHRLFMAQRTSSFPYNRFHPLPHMVPWLMRGASFYHPVKLGKVRSNDTEITEMFCRILRFYNDPSGDLVGAFQVVH